MFLDREHCQGRCRTSTRVTCRKKRSPVAAGSDHLKIDGILLHGRGSFVIRISAFADAHAHILKLPGFLCTSFEDLSVAFLDIIYPYAKMGKVHCS